MVGAMNSADFSKLLLRIHDGGSVATEEERLALEDVSCVLNQPPPKYACPECWLKRLLKEVREALDVGREIRSGV